MYDGNISERDRVLLRVSGTVQGVSFRKQTMMRALELGVTGWVRNLADGSVEGCFEGSRFALCALLKWCSKGPERSEVASMESLWQPYRGEFIDFCIL